jgi:hypothetical protein
MKNQSNIKVKIPKALFELYKKGNSKIDSKGVLKEMLKNQLKGMLEEATEQTPVTLQNTGDETNLQKAIDKNPTMRQSLSKINSANELDGALETITSYFGLQNMPKTTLLAAFKAALNNKAPEDSNITTSLKEGVKKVIRIKKK